MEKEMLFRTEDNTIVPIWNSSSFGVEIQPNELNCGSEQLSNFFFNPNWDNSMDQSDPFESSLSSMVSSPAAANSAVPGGGGAVLRELIGRLGSICSSGEISPQSCIGGNNSTDTSRYCTPLNSPPKLNLSMMDRQMRENFPIPGNHLPTHPSTVTFSAYLGSAERAVRFSGFGNRNSGGLNGQFGLIESEFPGGLTPRMESGKLSRASSNQSIKISGSPMGVLENRNCFLHDGNSDSDKKFSRNSTSPTPEKADFGDFMEESSVSEQIPGGEISMKGQTDANAKKRKSFPRGKAKETPLFSPARDSRVATESDESNAKRSKPDEATGNEKVAEKSKAEASEKGKASRNGSKKESKDAAKSPEPPKDYIHVRARRGQATDSHSLAERVRREKISERMKFLQDLVPGCNKVTGKAVMLDEIINYVQSLQRQVEFLSLKLATVNPRMGLNMEALLSKDIFLQSRGSVLPNIYPFGYQSPQGPFLHSGILPNGTENSSSVHRNPSMQLPPIDVFCEAASQHSTFWGDDLESVVQMSFGQNEQHSFHGEMKLEQ